VVLRLIELDERFTPDQHPADLDADRMKATEPFSTAN
jgi:hypothetical protein